MSGFCLQVPSFLSVTILEPLLTREIKNERKKKKYYLITLVPSYFVVVCNSFLSENYFPRRREFQKIKVKTMITKRKWKFYFFIFSE